MSLIRIVIVIALLTMPPLICGQSADDRYPFVRDGKLGFIDYQGREVISPLFSNDVDMAFFDNGLAPVFEANRGSGYIDPAGKFVIGPTEIWGSVRPFHEGVAGVMIWNKQKNSAGWIDRTGKIIFSGTGTEGTYFSNGLMSMQDPNGKWGFVDKNFQFVIQPKFSWANEFAEGRAEVTLNDKSGFIDTSGKIVVPLKYDMAWGFQNGLALVRRDIEAGTMMTMEGKQPRYRYQYGFIDHDGNEVIPLQFEEATYFSEGYALVVPSNFERYAVIDKQGRFVHEPEFEEVSEFHEGLAKACVKQKCGFIDTSGTWVIRPAFSSTRDFWHGLAAVAWQDGDYGYINKSGKIIWRSTTAPQSSTSPR